MNSTKARRTFVSPAARPGLRGLFAFSLGCLAVSLMMAPDASARGMSESRKKKIAKAFAKFQKRGEIPGDDVPRIPWERAITFKSRYYNIKTNTSRDVASYIGLLMDAQAVALRQIFQFKMKLQKINIWTMRTREDFVSVSASELRVQIGPSTGGFWTTALGGTICLPYIKSGHLHPGNVMMHEATHQFMNAALGRDIPIWLNEGIAVLFEESKYNPYKKKLDVFIVPRMRLLYLQREMRRDAHVKFKDLFTTQQINFSARYYGASWSFIYWIFRSAGDDRKEALRRQKAFNKYLFDVKKGRDDASRLFYYLGMKQDEVEKKWKKWVLSLDANDERGGTRFKGEAPYVKKELDPRDVAEAEEAAEKEAARKAREKDNPPPAEETSSEMTIRKLKERIADPDTPDYIKKRLKEMLYEEEHRRKSRRR